MDQGELMYSSLYIALFCTLTICSVACSYSEKGKAVTFIVPEGFRGMFILGENGKYEPGSPATFVIPEDRVLRVGDLSSIRQWHETRAQYSNGTPIKEFEAAKASDVTVHSLGTVNEWAIFYVGTLDEARAARAKKVDLVRELLKSTRGEGN
jgi:hypothetical protein